MLLSLHTPHISGDLCDGCVAVLMWKYDRIQTHRDLATMERPGAGESREVQLTCQQGERGRGGCYSQYAVPGGGIHSQGDDLIWAQLDEKLSVVF